MNALKIFFQMLIVLCFVFGQPSFAHAEEKDGIWYEDGESFNLTELDNALLLENIAEAESIYNEWVKRRQEMLKNGSKFGFFDMRLKYVYALIQSNKKEYENCIATADEVLAYLQANITDESDKDFLWTRIIRTCFFLKRNSYNALGDKDNSSKMQQEIVKILEAKFPVLEKMMPSDNRGILNMLNCCAEDYFDLTEYSKAADIRERILPQMEKILGVNNPQILLIYCRLADSYYGLKEYNKAADIWERILPQIEKVFGVNAPRTRLVKIWLAHAYRYIAPEKAFRLYEEVLKSDIEIYGESSELTFDSYCNLADHYYSLKEYNKAADIWERILPQMEKVFGVNAPRTRLVKTWLAHAYRYIAPEKAFKLYEEVLKSDIEIYGETAKETLQTYKDLIYNYHAFGKFKEIDTLLDHVIPIAEKNLEDGSDLKREILDTQAFYYSQTNRHRESMEVWKKILAMPIGNRNKIRSLTMLADDCRVFGDYSNALKYILEAWDIYEKYFPEDEYVRSEILHFMSVIYGKLGNNNEAINFAQEALNLSIKLCGYDSVEVLNARHGLAMCYSQARQYDTAVELWEEDYELCIRLFGNDTPHKILCMYDIADSYRSLHDYESGIYWTKEMLNESIRLRGEKDTRTLYGYEMLALFYSEDKDTVDDAIEILEWVLATKLEILDEQNALIYKTMINLSMAYNNSSRWKEAIPLYEKVIERRENRIGGYGALNVDEKRSLISKESWAYYNAAALYYFDNNFLDAFRILERGRSRLLVDSYSEQLVKSSGILEEEEVLKLNEYKAGLINYANRIEDAFRSGDEKARFNLETEQRNLMNEYAAYKESLQNKYPKYKTVSQANKLDFDHDKNILPDDTAFVEFMVGESSIWIFMFDKTDDIKAVKIDMPKNFLSKCSLYREFLAHSGLRTTQEVSANDKKFNEQRKSLSKYLSEILLLPIKDYISGYSNLIISPDSDLNNIPFETLEFNDKPAVESFNISYVPSFSVLKLMYEAGEKNSKLTDRQDLFAMGNAFYGGNDNSASRKSLDDFSKDQRERGKFDVANLKELKWDNLAGTKEEINRVSKMFAAKKIFSEKAASESNLKLSNRRGNLSSYKYFLFATHGIFMSYAPEYSSIVLSQGTDSKEDGYVTVGEWMGLDLNSDLVFLSACESGLGEYQAGEGIIGIPYALTIAGNKNTVMSLWKVYDTVTAEFVSTFFKKISNGKSAVIALNETKREFLKSDNPVYQSPAVWAAFLLYGF